MNRGQTGISPTEIEVIVIAKGEPRFHAQPIDGFGIRRPFGVGVEYICAIAYFDEKVEGGIRDGLDWSVKVLTISGSVLTRDEFRLSRLDGFSFRFCDRLSVASHDTACFPPCCLPILSGREAEAVQSDRFQNVLML